MKLSYAPRGAGSRRTATGRIVLAAWALTFQVGASGCAPQIPAHSAQPPAPDAEAIARGRTIWFENTYGGEKFFAFLERYPDPSKRIRVGFANVLDTPRKMRFQIWGTLNDPDCKANPAGGRDLCPDPSATGVIGIRQVRSKAGLLYGVSCASCHAGFDPLHPPRDPNEPSWDNIHATIGDQYLDAGALFAANLDPSDPRRFIVAAWPKGTVDTTFLFDDSIVNPGAITPIWAWKDRPTFHVGLKRPMLRNGQGGEDDMGAHLAAIRVYTNLGACFAECVAPRPARPDPTAPIDVAQCRRDCPDFPPERDLDDLEAFLRAQVAPRYPARPADNAIFARGRAVFASACASCHTVTGEGGRALSNDEVNPLAADPANATNACRALTMNWEGGHVWAQFSSDVYKRRAAAGEKGYRTMPLTAAWATTPFLHNQSIGGWPLPSDPPERRAEVYREAMRELLSPSRAPKVHVLPAPVGPFPAGTPVTQVFSRDPVTGEVRCSDAVENHGHHFGSSLPERDKNALIDWLQFQ